MSRVKITAEEFEKNVEEVVDNCSENGIIYEIEYEGKIMLMVPYDEYADVIEYGEDLNACK